MAPLNGTDIIIQRFNNCILHFNSNGLQKCMIRYPRTYFEVIEWFQCSEYCNRISGQFPSDYLFDPHSSPFPRPRPGPSVPSALSSRNNQQQGTSNDDILKAIAYYFLLPLVVILIAVCLVLGVVLIVKSYKMKPLKHNLALAIRRSRQVGHAPENQYIAPAEVRASQIWTANTVAVPSTSDNRKSLPPPEVIRAARERASQIFTT